MLADFPRPQTLRVEEVLRDLAAEGAEGGGLPGRLAGLDSRLLLAAVEDVRGLLQRVLCWFGVRASGSGVHDRKHRNMLTACGWIKVTRAYCRCVQPHRIRRKETGNTPGVFPLDAALRLEHGATPAAREMTVRCGALCGSFVEATDMLARLTPVRIAPSTLRLMTLRAGKKALENQQNPACDIRPVPKVLAPDNRHAFPTQRTMFIMMDATGVPCTRVDTAESTGRNPEEAAGTREIKVGVIGYYSWLDLQERPVPETGSVTHVVSPAEAVDFGVLLRKAANSRGYGTTVRVQLVGDGADWIANVAKQDFPDAIFTADFYHACEHLHALCTLLHLPQETLQKEYRQLKGLLFRHGATSLLRRLKKSYPTLHRRKAPRKELAYFEKRLSAMRYGLFRKKGLYIASGHAEAACRTDVVRRCKQAGMHWRHHNAARVCAILASLRSRKLVA